MRCWPAKKILPPDAPAMIPASARKAALVSPRRDAWPMRAFIGIPLPAEGQEAVAGLQDYLRALPPFSEFRWCWFGQFHPIGASSTRSIKHWAGSFNGIG